jgi:hypothetical protein
MNKCLLRDCKNHNCDSCKSLETCKDKFDKCCSPIRISNMRCNIQKCNKRDRCLCYEIKNRPPIILNVNDVKRETKQEKNYRLIVDTLSNFKEMNI